MNCDNTSDLDYQKTEEETLTCEVSDDALEAASGTPTWGTRWRHQISSGFLR